MGTYRSTARAQAAEPFRIGIVATPGEVGQERREVRGHRFGVGWPSSPPPAGAAWTVTRQVWKSSHAAEEVIAGRTVCQNSSSWLASSATGQTNRRWTPACAKAESF
jgi:hypothetical protein